MTDRPSECPLDDQGRPHGKWRRYFPNGQMRAEGYFDHDVETGRWRTWYENGQLETEGEFQDGLREGLLVEYHPNGQKSGEGHLQKGKISGLATTWDENGNRLDRVEYEDGLRHGQLEEYHPNGQLIEISRNSFAIDKTIKAVHDFGEDVDIFKTVNVVSHDGHGYQVLTVQSSA